MDLLPAPAAAPLLVQAVVAFPLLLQEEEEEGRLGDRRRALVVGLPHDQEAALPLPLLVLRVKRKKKTMEEEEEEA